LTMSARSATSRASLDRLRALGDGIFAFAMTVLVLDVRLPAGQAPLEGPSLLAALENLLPAAMACVLSFLVLCMYWIAHHNTFLVVARTNRSFVALSMLFLLCIAFVPFAASVLARAPRLSVAIVLYGATLTATSLVLLALVQYALGGARLADASPRLEALRQAAVARILAPVALYLASMALAPWAPTLSLLAYVLLPLVYLLPSGVDHWADG
jgi:uncharacterized membrane protein